MRTPAHIFQMAHEAMGTTFEIAIDGHPVTYARQAAQAAFAELDRLEDLFSVYIEHSDIARIRRRAQGEEVMIGPDTLEILKISEHLRRQTLGAFDVAYRSRTLRNLDRALFSIESPPPLVRIMEAPLYLDLGAIGKGFALDRMAMMLEEWSITSVLLHGGTSTLLARDAPRDQPDGWPVRAGNHTVSLRKAALSASGTGVRGMHIIDPQSGQPAQARQRVWILATQSATVTDALSTAFMVMNPSNIHDFLKQHPDVTHLQEDPNPST